MRRIRPEWFDRVLCRGKGQLFFSEDETDIAAAKAICAVCPVFGECRSYGAGVEHGVWAGKSEADRLVEATRKSRSSALTDGSMGARRS